MAQTIKQRALEAMKRMGRVTTGALAREINHPSNFLATRLIEMEDSGLCQRVDGKSGSGTVAQWEAVA